MTLHLISHAQLIFPCIIAKTSSLLSKFVKHSARSMEYGVWCVAVAVAVVYGVCSILASFKKEDGPMMKALGQNGEYIRRKDFEDNPAGYFKRNRGK